MWSQRVSKIISSPKLLLAKDSHEGGVGGFLLNRSDQGTFTSQNYPHPGEIVNVARCPGRPGDWPLGQADDMCINEMHFRMLTLSCYLHITDYSIVSFPIFLILSAVPACLLSLHLSCPWIPLYVMMAPLFQQQKELQPSGQKQSNKYFELFFLLKAQKLITRSTVFYFQSMQHNVQSCVWNSIQILQNYVFCTKKYRFH